MAGAKDGRVELDRRRERHHAGPAVEGRHRGLDRLHQRAPAEEACQLRVESLCLLPADVEPARTAQVAVEGNGADGAEADRTLHGVELQHSVQEERRALGCAGAAVRLLHSSDCGINRGC